MFCTLEAPGAMTTGMGNSMHMFHSCWLERWLELLELGGRVVAGLLVCLISI
jgi:hypothetical protein